MNKIAVNPTQFITCRLCLEELGSYQIVPSVKEQIAYCFDIKVEPFDGLPQLICQKCEEILNNFSNVKNKFREKQEELMKKINKTQEKVSDAQQPTKTESQGNFDNDSNKENLTKSKKRKHTNSPSSSSNKLEHKKSPKNKKCGNKYRNNDGNDEIDVRWSASYKKQFVCSICSAHWSNVKMLRMHITKKHGALHKKYGFIFKRHCQVMLQKIDRKPNITGSRSKVAYSRDKIVKNVNAEYHIIYTTKDYKGDSKHNTLHAEVCNTKSDNTHKKKSYSSDSSDDELVVKRKRRLYSTSSNETIVLDEKSNVSDTDDKNSLKSETAQTPSIYIDLEDLSDDESVKGEEPPKMMVGKQTLVKNDGSHTADLRTIDDIITTCRNRYLKKRTDTDSSKDLSTIANKLQHKLFSIGRKVINKRVGINCTPLLRFIEHKNLDIVWIPRETVKDSQDFIRIMPRRKNLQEKLKYDTETGWTNFTSVGDKSKQGHSLPNVCNGISTPEGSSICLPDKAVISDANLVTTDTRKLLNENPVANPKQLPKKYAKNIPQEDNNTDYMPIITSTTSLPEPFIIHDGSENSEIDSTTTDKRQPDAPRIKVKPVSELMSAETLNRMQNSQTPVTIPVTIVGKGLPLPVQNVTVPVMTSQSVLKNKTKDLISPEPTWKSEFMILDTVEFPNQRTNSPFLYLRQLLQMHNIVLLDTHTELVNGFHCLIKFKVLYKQEVQNQPVVLCLALFSSNNVFCFKVKDRNNENLDILKISPNWQWEVLKIFKGEVVYKLLSNAQKIGQDVYECTNTFLCLLKSINILGTS